MTKKNNLSKYIKPSVVEKRKKSVIKTAKKSKKAAKNAEAAGVSEAFQKDLKKGSEFQSMLQRDKFEVITDPFVVEPISLFMFVTKTQSKAFLRLKKIVAIYDEKDGAVLYIPSIGISNLSRTKVKDSVEKYIKSFPLLYRKRFIILTAKDDERKLTERIAINIEYIIGYSIIYGKNKKPFVLLLIEYFGNLLIKEAEKELLAMLKGR